MGPQQPIIIKQIIQQPKKKKPAAKKPATKNPAAKKPVKTKPIKKKPVKKNGVSGEWDSSHTHRKPARARKKLVPKKHQNRRPDPNRIFHKKNCPDTLKRFRL